MNTFKVGAETDSKVEAVQRSLPERLVDVMRREPWGIRGVGNWDYGPAKRCRKRTSTEQEAFERECDALLHWIERVAENRRVPATQK
jgi:hypothetical protein